jgi:hypothetical protein
VPFVIDEHPVGALGSCCAYPSLGVTVRLRRLRRVFTIFRPSLAKISSKTAVNLASRSPDEEVEGTVPASEIHDQIAGLLSGPGAIGMFSEAEDVDVPGGKFHDEQHVQAAQEGRRKIVSTWKKSQASSPYAGARRNARQEVSCLRGAGRRAARRIRRTVAALRWWPSRETAVRAAVSPGGVLPGQPQYEVADFLAGLRSAGLTR